MSGTFCGLHRILKSAAVNPRIFGRWETIKEHDYS